MEAYFIFREGCQQVGSLIGYTTEKQAYKALVGSEDWNRELCKYDLGNGRSEVPQELIDLGLYYWSEYTQTYLFRREVWSRKIWSKYVKDHYKIEKREFEIVFK